MGMGAHCSLLPRLQVKGLDVDNLYISHIQVNKAMRQRAWDSGMMGVGAWLVCTDGCLHTEAVMCLTYFWCMNVYPRQLKLVSLQGPTSQATDAAQALCTNIIC